MTKQSSSERILNTEQKKAVQFGRGPLLIIAGAGTGKTTVITERIKYLITKGLAKPQEILALTFTEKASKEMQDRIDEGLPYGLVEMWISTFHAFCDRVLRSECLSIGLNPNYTLMGEAEAIQFFTSHLFEFQLSYFRPLGNPTKFISGLLQHFNRLHDEDVTPLEYRNWVKNQKTIEQEERQKFIELANAYKTYEELKIKYGVFDYADLIAHTLKLFRSRKKILNNYKKQFKYILIDEFQDTNIAQNELAMALAGLQSNITVVGDDDQAIYRWRGAAISNIIQFRKHFKKAKVVVLTKNYRSTQEILNASYTLIQHNNPDRLEIAEKINKELECVRRVNGQLPKLLFAKRSEDEAQLVGKEIQRLITKGVQYKDIAILVRANNHAEPFIRALSQLGIPYQFLGPGQLFRQPEVKDIIAYLKVLYDIHDNIAFYRVLTMDIFNISPRDVAEIVSYAKTHGISLFRASEELISTVTSISPLLTLIIKQLGLIKKETAGQIAYYFLKESGLLQSFASYQTQQDERKAEHIAQFFDRLKSYETNHDDASVFKVVEWLNLAMDLGESPLAANADWGDKDAVNILTVHSAKGLEFSVVFLVNTVNARFPTTQRREQIPIPDALVKEILPVGDYHIEEERRLFYVGMTRARDYLYFTSALYYGDGKREKKLSPFVSEAIGIQENKVVSNEQEVKQLDLSNWIKLEPVETSVKKRQVEYMWYTHIETFRRCPLQYKYRYILKIPVPQSAALGFGDVMHKTMQLFYQSVLKNEHPLKKDLLLYYDEAWKSNGFINKMYEDTMREHGRELLRQYYDVGYKKQVKKTIAVEQAFKIKVSNTITLGGRIDRVDRASDGTLEIIDYKTGAAPKKRDPSEDFQLSLYALAAHDKGLYGEKPENILVSFYFFEGQERMTARRTKEQLEKVKEEIVSSAEEIESSPLLPAPGKHCAFCEFRLLCEAWK